MGLGSITKSMGISYVLPVLICAVTVITLSMLTASLSYPLVMGSRGAEETADSILAVHGAIESIAYRVGSSATVYVNTPPDYPLFIGGYTVKCTRNILFNSRLLGDPKGVVESIDGYGVKYTGVLILNPKVIAGVSRVTLTCIEVVDGRSIVALGAVNMVLDCSPLHGYVQLSPPYLHVGQQLTINLYCLASYGLGSSTVNVYVVAPSGVFTVFQVQVDDAGSSYNPIKYIPIEVGEHVVVVYWHGDPYSLPIAIYDRFIVNY